MKKFSLLLMLFSLFSLVAKAQTPANDICANAISVVVNGPAVNANNSNTVSDGPNPSCGGSSAIKDIWYKFVYGGGIITIETQLGTNSDTRLAVYTACGGTQLACNDDITGSYRSRIILSCPALVLGNTYYIQAGGYNSIIGTFTMSILASGIQGCTNPLATNYSPCSTQDNGTCTFPTLTSQFGYAPTGTNCLNIQYTSTSSGNITGYNWSFPGGTPSTSTLQNPVVNYPSGGPYTATLVISDVNNSTSTSTQNITVITGTIVTVDITPDANPTQTSWKVFDGGNAVIAQGTSNDATFCIAGGCHRFEIYDSGNNGLTGTGNYKIFVNGIQTAQGAAFTSRDIRFINCPDGISCDQTLTATLGLNAVPFSNSWYTFTPAVNGQYRVSTCGLATCDTKIWIYDYCRMANFDESNAATYTYNDDFCGVQAQTDVFFTGGHTYYLRVGDSNGSCTGSYQVLFEFVGAVTGCMDVLACNYNPLAGIAGVCYYNGDPHCSGLGPDLEVSLNDLYSSLYSTTITSNDNCLVNEGCLQGTGTRQILRFTTRINNIGNQDYYIGVPTADNPQFEYDLCHNHYHYEGYAEYLLFDQQGNPMPQIGFKNGFCVLDLSCPTGISAQYSCGNMGITAGCGDIYSSGLSCQWIDVTGVPAGDYYLVVRTNWDHSPDKNGRYELRYDNNWAQVCIHFERDASNNIINFTKTIVACPIIEDCLGVPFGNTYADCAGNCPGVVKRGDINSDGALSDADVQQYLVNSLLPQATPTTCIDLNNDGEITVADAAYLDHCLHEQADLGVPPANYTECPWDDEVLDQNELVTLGITNLNTNLGYFDVYMLNPQNEVVALQFTLGGATINSIENLLDPLVWDPHIHFVSGQSSIAAISNGHTKIPVHSNPTGVLRIHYTALTSNTICVASIVDIMNDLLFNVMTQTGGCVTTNPLQVSFTTSATEICEGASITYSANPGAGNYSYAWTFFGGNPGSAISPVVQINYAQSGVYTAQLIVTDNATNQTGTASQNITVFPGSTWYFDSDGDGYGVLENALFACSQPQGYVGQAGDCNDLNALVNPAAIEICGNGIDDNCDGNATGDNVTVICPAEFTISCEQNFPEIIPQIINGCQNDTYSVDIVTTGTNCNGLANILVTVQHEDGTLAATCSTIGHIVDETAPIVNCPSNITVDALPGLDFSIVSYSFTATDNCTQNLTISCNPPSGSSFPIGQTVVSCSATDQCNNTTLCSFVVTVNFMLLWYLDTDGDGFGKPGTSIAASQQPPGYSNNALDCNDDLASVNPQAQEVCNGIDDNCNGTIDEGFDTDADGYTSCNGDCNDNNAAIKPGAIEICNGIDDNCNGIIDEGFDIDGDGYTSCNGDCNDNNAAIKPGAIEICNGIDDDCDNLIDEGFDVDGDGYTTCAGDCNDNNAAVRPGAAEICYNGIDDNCNGLIDEGCCNISLTGVVSHATCPVSADGAIDITAVGGTPPYIYSWNGGTPTTVADRTNLAPGIYTVVVTDLNACTATATFQVLDNGGTAPAQPSAINGPLGVCRSQMGVVFTATPVAGATSYIWTLPAGATGASSGNSITLNFSATYNTGNLCVRAVNICGQSSNLCTSVIYLTAIPAVPGVISGGNAGACAGNTVAYNISAVPFASAYEWTTPINSTILSGQGTTSISVSYNAGTGASGTVRVRAINCRGNSNYSSLNVYGAPGTPAAIIGTATGVCAGSTQTYSISAVNGATTYNWTVPAGCIINSGQGTTSIMVTFNGAFVSGTLAVTAGSVCGTSAQRTLAISAALATLPNIVGQSGNLCGGGTFTYTIAAVAGATGYNWTIPSGCGVVADLGTSITITIPSNFVSGNLCYTVTNACGISALKCLSLTRNPSTPSFITGSSSVCPNATNVQYSTPQVGSLTYTWTVPANVTIVSGQGTNTIVVNWGPTAGSVFVKANNTCGSSANQLKSVSLLSCLSTLNPGNGDAMDYHPRMVVYPNPNNGTFTIQAPFSGQIYIKNELGQIIRAIKLNENNFANYDVSGLSAGLYIISGEFKGEYYTERIIVTH
jgi:PKD repeat protein